jgi:hypothetical protein
MEAAKVDLLFRDAAFRIPVVGARDQHWIEQFAIVYGLHLKDVIGMGVR